MTESKTMEFKREYVEDIKKTLLAFANTDGGELYIGISNDGLVCGVADSDQTMLKVTNAIRDAIRPDMTLFTDCRAIELDGKPVVLVTVQRGTARPYYLAGKGIRPEGIFVRQGASTVPASEAAILSMIKETSGDSYEDARSLNQQLTFEKATSYFQKKGLPFSEAQFRTLGILGEDSNFTNLGLLLSDQCSHSIKLAVFEGTVKTVFKDRTELSGSLFSQLEAAYAFIDRYNRTRSEFKGLERLDSRDYPPEALREALLNAIVHRDYAYPGATLISIFDDRIEFVTIGGLVKGISYDDILLGISISRNRRLADIFYRLKLIEAYGTGITKIRNSYSEFSMSPQIEVTSNAFKITLPNSNYKQPVIQNLLHDSDAAYQRSVPGAFCENAYKSSRESMVLQLLCHQNPITRKEVQEALNISQATAILLLREMTEKGLLRREGSGRFLRYYKD